MIRNRAVRAFVAFNIIGYFSKASIIATGLLIINRFSAGAIGPYFVYTSYAILMIKLGDWGIGRLNIVLTEPSRDQRVAFSNILFFRLIFSVAFLIATALIAPSVEDPLLFVFIVLQYDLAAYYLLFSSNFDKAGKFRTKMIFDFIQNFSVLAYVVLQTVILNNLNVFSVVVGIAGCRGATLLVLILFQKSYPKVSDFAKQDMSIIFKNGLNLFFISTCIALYCRIGFVLLPYFGVDMVRIGGYGKIARLMQDVAFVATQVSVYFFPRFVGKRDSKYLRKSIVQFLSIQTLMSLVVVANLLIFKSFIVNTLLKLTPVLDIIPPSTYLIVVLAIIASFQNQTLVQFFLARQKYGMVQISLLGAVICSILANCLLIPRIGILGSAWATLAAEAVAAILLLAMVQKFFRNGPEHQQGVT